MVTWQLQHNREQHELRLQRLRNFISLETSTATATATTSASAGEHTSGNNVLLTGNGHANMTWIEKITQLVASEKIKLMKQKESAKVRLENAERELDTLKVLNTSLCNNRVEWHRRLHAAKGNVQVYQNTVIKAANKVKILMQKLDSSVPVPATTTGSASASASSDDLEGHGDGKGQGQRQGKEKVQGQGQGQGQGATHTPQGTAGTAHSSSSNIFDRHQQSPNG